MNETEPPSIQPAFLVSLVVEPQMHEKGLMLGNADFGTGEFKKAFKAADVNSDYVLVLEEFKTFYARTEQIELQVYMTIPFVEESKEGEAESQFFNTVCLAGPSGEVVVHYRKTHLWDYVDGSWASRGDSPGFVETEFGRVGIGVCYDIHRLAQLYSNSNLWALLYSVAWVGHPTDGPTERWFRKDLSETYLGRDGLKCFVVAANWSTDREYFWDGAGYSSIYGQDGQRLAYLNDEVGDSILYSDIPCHSS
ncbi:Nit2 [Symbiodinium sp. CCMP2456]|nr:Nit2 [Symbiodinium sp. CCMP2456]